MGLTRLGILSLLVGDDDHAANLCMGGLCGQNQWAALWAKKAVVWAPTSAKCQAHGAPPQNIRVPGARRALA